VARFSAFRDQLREARTRRFLESRGLLDASSRAGAGLSAVPVAVLSAASGDHVQLAGAVSGASDAIPNPVAIAIREEDIGHAEGALGGLE